MILNLLLKTRRFYNFCKSIIHGKFCPYCNKKALFKSSGVEKRINAMCPNCNSLERHRFLYYLYKKSFLDTKNKIKILHTAPEGCVAKEILKNKNIEYYPIDLFPENYSYLNCTKEDVTNLSFEDKTFDYVISNHVLEHITDDKLALNEFLRVLKDDGVLYLSFPISFQQAETLEDANVTTEEERLKYFGQSDHVRVYGINVIDKLKRNYNAVFVTSKDVLSKKQMSKLGIKNEYVFVIKKK